MVLQKRNKGNDNEGNNTNSMIPLNGEKYSVEGYHLLKKPLGWFKTNMKICLEMQTEMKPKSGVTCINIFRKRPVK